VAVAGLFSLFVRKSLINSNQSIISCGIHFTYFCDQKKMRNLYKTDFLYIIIVVINAELQILLCVGFEIFPCP
jgi:hypothetical protein